MKTLYDLLQSVYGISGIHRINPLVDEIDIALTRILPSNPNRLAFVFINLSDQNIYLSPDSDAGADHGIWIAPNGGSFIVQWDKDLILPTLEWNGVAGADNSDIFIIEILTG